MTSRGAPPKSLLDGPDLVKREIEDRAPKFCAAATAAAVGTTRSLTVTYQFLRARTDPEAAALRHVVTQAANDWIDLLFDLMHGRGRAALRAARSLFEHCVTAQGVIADPAEATRYVDHLAVADRHFLALRRPETFLKGKDLKAYRHDSRKLDRETRGPAADALARYGSGFNRAWTQVHLRDRAAEFDLEDGYNFYRIASLPVHGSAAGVFGGKRVIDGKDVFRTGPALAACPLAAIYGTWFSDEAADAVAALCGPTAMAAWKSALSEVQGAITEYVAATTAIDNRLWPKKPPLNVAPMIVVDSNEDAELWLALPESRVAFPFPNGRFRMTPEQDRAYKGLLQVLRDCQLERVGILFVDAWGDDGAALPKTSPQPLDSVLQTAPIQLFPDGKIGLPEDLQLEPYLDDLLPWIKRGTHRS